MLMTGEHVEWLRQALEEDYLELYQQDNAQMAGKEALLDLLGVENWHGEDVVEPTVEGLSLSQIITELESHVLSVMDGQTIKSALMLLKEADGKRCVHRIKL